MNDTTSIIVSIKQFNTSFFPFVDESPKPVSVTDTKEAQRVVLRFMAKQIDARFHADFRQFYIDLHCNNSANEWELNSTSILRMLHEIMQHVTFDNVVEWYTKLAQSEEGIVFSYENLVNIPFAFAYLLSYADGIDVDGQFIRYFDYNYEAYIDNKLAQYDEILSWDVLDDDGNEISAELAVGDIENATFDGTGWRIGCTVIKPIIFKK